MYILSKHSACNLSPKTLRFIFASEAARRPVSRVESVLQINDSFTDQVICAESIVIHHLDVSHRVVRECTIKLKHPRKKMQDEFVTFSALFLSLVGSKNDRQLLYWQ